MCILRGDPARFPFMKLDTDGATIYTSFLLESNINFIKIKIQKKTLYLYIAWYYLPLNFSLDLCYHVQLS